jgi:hypothetical protein
VDVARLGLVEDAVGLLDEREAGSAVGVCQLSQRHRRDTGGHLADDRVAFDLVAGVLVAGGL